MRLITHKARNLNFNKVLLRVISVFLFLLVVGVKIYPIHADTHDSTDPSKAKEASAKLTILLDWYVNPDHLPLLVAKQGGFFEENGLDVDLIVPSDPSAPPRLIAAGKGDIAISYQPQLYLQAAAGLQIMRFGTLVSTPLNSLVILKDGPIKDLSDLAGKKIGFSVAGMEEILLNTMLGKVGLGLQDVELINVNFALTSALATGQVDAVIGAFRNFELTLLELAGTKGKPFFVEEWGVPNHDELIYIAHQDKRNDPRLKQFLNAIEAATNFILNHPNDALKLMIDYDQQLNNPLNLRAFKDTLRRFSASPAALDHKRYQRFADYMLETNMVETLPPLKSYAVDLYAPQ